MSEDCGTFVYGALLRCEKPSKIYSCTDMDTEKNICICEATYEYADYKRKSDTIMAIKMLYNGNTEHGAMNL